MGGGGYSLGVTSVFPRIQRFRSKTGSPLTVGRTLFCPGYVLSSSSVRSLCSFGTSAMVPLGLFPHPNGIAPSKGPTPSRLSRDFPLLLHPSVSRPFPERPFPVSRNVPYLPDPRTPRTQGPVRTSSEEVKSCTHSSVPLTNISPNYQKHPPC